MPRHRTEVEDLQRRRTVPAWAMSAGLHFCLLLLLSLVIRVAPRGAAVEPARGGGIVLVQNTADKTEYFSEGEQPSAAASGGEAAPSLSSALPAAEQSPVELSGLLPSAADAPGLGGAAADALPSAGSFTAGAGVSRGIGDAGKVQTSVFGVQGTGRKFVYVFDRSGSMEGFAGRPLAAAKAELIASLQNLQSVHQFQIIFYNDAPRVMNLTGLTPRFAFGDEGGKRAAAEFVRGITADGGTRHMEALKLAVGMQPDVIFFLTDADEPQISPAELAQIRVWNKAEASINAVEFGVGPPTNSDNFLKRLARQNHGQHVYVDVSKLPSKR